MTVSKSNVPFLTFIRRLDRWLLLRAPMLWRTRLPYLLVLLGLIMATTPFLQTRVENPREVVDFANNTVSMWSVETIVAWVVLVLWVSSIIETPVGELPPYRHAVTIVAVVIGSYVLLMVPSWLAYPRVRAIAGVGVNDQQLTMDDDFLSEYSNWECVPADLWDEQSSEHWKLEKLREVARRYNRAEIRVEKPEKSPFCFSNSFIGQPYRPVGRYEVNFSRQAVEFIRGARGFKPYHKSEILFDNDYYGKFDLNRESWSLVIALILGILTGVLSYPLYVWRRIFRLS